ncbi:MAG: putative DCC family thiol-disulfide oxidoreductase YuxK [Polaribacter sp.]|jgi:predicted DCC family thiol-disulfide oxidoreductase YuxK
MTELTIFYDGSCPICVAEKRHLCHLDSEQKIALQDIHAERFSQRFSHNDPVRTDQILHGKMAK